MSETKMRRGARVVVRCSCGAEKTMQAWRLLGGHDVTCGPTCADWRSDFWSNVDKATNEGGCWEWTGFVSQEGYGRFAGRGSPYTTRLVHRIALLEAGLDIPDGYQVDHLCRNRRCCNPAHLEAVTAAENVRRSTSGEVSARLNLAKTHCPKGHPYSGDNLYVPKAGNRMCRACARDRAKARYWAQKAAP